MNNVKPLKTFLNDDNIYELSPEELGKSFLFEVFKENLSL